MGLRDFRPKLHFTPEEMWLNDPNGLVYENGRYHLFYQYHPASTVWGPMHWGHAISTDLVKWEHLPVALYPDTLGTIYSGSAVYDKNNTSGFGALGKAPIVTIFTHHQSAHDLKSQNQSIAYSLDGINYVKYDGNPVIPNPGIRDFRDPKVFWNQIKNCWSLVLAAGDCVLFYSSPDLKKWGKTGEFRVEGNHSNGVWECPDLFPLETEAGEKWVLIVSMGMPIENGGARTQYFIGDFDGDKFICDYHFDKPVWLDEGFDNYAGVTYDNAKDRILIGWGINWRYADVSPTGEFCGLMTLARKLSLIDTPNSGLRLACLPVGVGDYIEQVIPISNGNVIPDEVFGLSIVGSGACEITLTNAVGQCLRFGVTNDNELFVDRSNAGDNSFSQTFSSELYSKKAVKRHFNGTYSLDAIFDVSDLELFIDSGTISMSLVVYPDTAYNRIYISGDVCVRYLKIKQMLL